MILMNVNPARPAFEQAKTGTRRKSVFGSRVLRRARWTFGARRAGRALRPRGARCAFRTGRTGFSRYGNGHRNGNRNNRGCGRRWVGRRCAVLIASDQQHSGRGQQQHVKSTSFHVHPRVTAQPAMIQAACENARKGKRLCFCCVELEMRAICEAAGSGPPSLFCAWLIQPPLYPYDFSMMVFSYSVRFGAGA